MNIIIYLIICDYYYCECFIFYLFSEINVCIVYLIIVICMFVLIYELFLFEVVFFYLFFLY